MRHLDDVAWLSASVRLHRQRLLGPAGILGADPDIGVPGHGVVIGQDSPTRLLAERDVPGLGQDHLDAADPALETGQVVQLARGQVDQALKK